MSKPTVYSPGRIGQFGNYVPVNGTPTGFKDADGNMQPGVVDASGYLKVNVAAGSGSGYAGQADKSAFTEGTGLIVVNGGEYNTSPSAPSSGQVAAARISAARGVHSNLRNDAGTETGILATPLRTDPVGTTKQPVNLFDGSGNAITSVGGALSVSGTFSPSSSTTASAPAQTVTGAAAVVLTTNASRKRAMLQNTGQVPVYCTYGATDPTATAYHFSLPAGGSNDDGSSRIWTDDVWKGVIRAFSAAAGSIVVTELT